MIGREDALKIAEKHHGAGFELYQISHGMPNSCDVYQSGDHSWAPDDVWCVLCSNHIPGKCMVGPSYAIVIHKETGKILYDGSAHDEG